MWLKWLPWKYLVRRAANAHGFLDPIPVLARLRKFSQPSEVTEPVELLRAGVMFHARGLMNSRAIQHNLDWIWPWWVERQFDPDDPSFVPRAFSLTHINLTHRNWTAVGIPDCDALPIVDPRGLVTPYWDGWSIDAWIIRQDHLLLAPSRLKDVRQEMDLSEGVRITTEAALEDLRLESRVEAGRVSGERVCRIRLTGEAETPAWLVATLRPYNPEGVSFIHRIDLEPDKKRWRVDGKPLVQFAEAADKHYVSDYRHGDVALHLEDDREATRITCDVGMATAAALFAIEPGEPRTVELVLPLEFDIKHAQPDIVATADRWDDSLDGHCALSVPDTQTQFLYDAALRTLVLHSPGDVYPGPYTYKRFWFRDAAFILHAMICAGMAPRCEGVIERFDERQTPFGYFHSQDGEWDSNGEALWTMERYCTLTGTPPKARWAKSIKRGAHWIHHKRVARRKSHPHAGLLPAGFSAEHLGPNDYYYWDDFWSVAGLQSAARMLRALDKSHDAEWCDEEAHDLMNAIERSLSSAAETLGRPAMPASPYRRLDSGCVGSIVAGYPLQLFDPTDERLTDTAEFLIESCLVSGGVFQDMIHSGINPYLTLHLAQVLLRAGDSRAIDCMQTVADLASPTGQWPEAIHPATRGGCMGDGQHVWAAAEWVMMVRNMFVLEEPRDNRLIVCSGIPDTWLDEPAECTFGPTPTPWGPVTVYIDSRAGRIRVECVGRWREQAPEIEVRLPGHQPTRLQPGQTSVVIHREPV